MTSGHPPGLPEFFLDRSLGRRPGARTDAAAGIRLRTLAEEYGIPADEEVPDTEWLAYAGHNGWPVLMKDERIRYRPAEQAVVASHGVQAFFLTSGNLRAAAMADQYLSAMDEIALACREAWPFLYAVSGSGIRRVSL